MRRLHIRTPHSTCVLEELLGVDDLSMNGTCGHSTVFDDCRYFTIRKYTSQYDPKPDEFKDGKSDSDNREDPMIPSLSPAVALVTAALCGCGAIGKMLDILIQPVVSLDQDYR